MGYIPRAVETETHKSVTYGKGTEIASPEPVKEELPDIPKKDELMNLGG